MAVMPPDTYKKETNMKRSEFIRDHHCSPMCAEDAANMAERAGVTWDKEEPEVLWIDPSRHPLYRILGNGQCEVSSILSGPRNWRAQEDPHPAMVELARRLFAERELSIAMEGQRTEVREGLADGRLKQATVPGPFPWEKPDIADLPDGDRTAVSGTAAWIERERVCRDLGGEVRSEEASGRRRIARILKASKSSYWYARHIGKVFEVESVDAEGLFDGYARVAGYRCFLVEPEDVEYLEFLDLGS